MLTIEAIKEMLKSCVSFDEHKEIMNLLEERKTQIHKALWDNIEKVSIQTGGISLDVASVEQYVMNLDSKETELLYYLAKQDELLNAALNDVKDLIYAVHLKMRELV